MTDEVIEKSETGGDNGFSRRNALKAGVAAGVGVAAWSGATITSLGGTPAYAATAACTGVINIAIGAECDNTDQTSTCTGGQFAYQHLNVTLAGFGITNPFDIQTCCETAAQNKPFFTWSQAGLQCTTHVEIWYHQCGGPSAELLKSSVIGPVMGTATGGQVQVDTQCFQFTAPVPPGTAIPNGSVFTNVYAKCNSIGAPTGCIT